MKTQLLLTILLAFLSMPYLFSQPDLAVTGIQFSVANRNLQQVNIRITVKNVGKANFASKKGQQEVLLYLGDQLIKRQAFINLGAGATLEISHTIVWGPELSKTTPLVKAMISYDPDIYMDGNKQNDDPNHKNDQFSRSSRVINGMW